jgi:hypothetical protein
VHYRKCISIRNNQFSGNGILILMALNVYMKEQIPAINENFNTSWKGTDLCFKDAESHRFIIYLPISQIKKQENNPESNNE